MSLLNVHDLTVEYSTEAGTARALDGVDFSVQPGEIVGIVGESGSGKSTIGLSIVGLLREPPARVVSGRIEFDGRDLLALSPRPLRTIRGRRIGMVFQDPTAALNPVLPVGDQVAEVLSCHHKMGTQQLREQTVSLLQKVGIAGAEERLDAYPHQFSVGMQQRIGIALALSGSPELLIADEPTTALDTTVQAQLLDLMAEVQRDRGLAVLLISHDLAVISELCQKVVVLYSGRVMENGPVGDVLSSPLHPYSRALLASTPARTIPGEALPVLPDPVVDAAELYSGCRFRFRCPRASERCKETPPEVEKGRRHRSWCFHPHIGDSS
ncbi:MAG: ABC transporter ATP-binding protein [Myxococcota bacterium]